MAVEEEDFIRLQGQIIEVQKHIMDLMTLIGRLSEKIDKLKDDRPQA